MLKSDALSQLKQLKQDIKASRNLHEGVVKGTANKFGFVTLDSGKDVFLPADEMAKVLPGDRIEVEVKKEPKNKVYALVERLIESPTKTFFGKYVTKGNAHFVEPDIAGMNQWFFIPPPKRKGAKTKDYVECKLTQHPIRSGKAQAAVVAVIGAEHGAGIEWDYAIQKHALSNSWSDDVEQELAGLSEETIEACSDRADLSDLSFVTIDSATTQDMDDALWAEVLEEGWLLRVAIADPVALIPEGGAIEREALARGSAVYFPGRSVPMLPAKISSELGSLMQDKIRLAKVVELKISNEGEILETNIVNAKICSKAKLDYQSASERMASGNPENPIDQILKTLLDLSQQLENWRQDNALVHQGKPEFYLELNEKQKIERIVPKRQTPAHKLVEACMVAVNRAVAQKLAEAAVPSLFVSHAGVREDRLEGLEAVLKKQLQIEELSLSDPAAYTSLVRGLSAEEKTQPLYALLSRQLEKTRLSSDAKPHFGMGLPAYTTITSPLRKAVDYLLHKQLDHFLSTGSWQEVPAQLVEQLDSKTQTVRAALYEVEQWLKCQFMKKSDKNLEAEVVRVFASGCQVRLKDNGIEGFISARELEGKYSFDQALMTLKGKEHSFELEQSITVDFKQVDWKRKQIQFTPAA